MSLKVLVIYDGREGGTVCHMANMIAQGARGENMEAICENVENAQVADLEAYNAVIIGSPCYFGGVSGKIKTFMDQSYSILGKLDGKVGGAFTASEHIGGGNEMTLRSIHDFFLIHGMIIQGDTDGDAFGPVAINTGGEDAEVIVDDSGECARLGKRVATLTKALN